MSRRSRLILLVLLIAGLAPGLWWRMPRPPLHHDAPVVVSPLANLPDQVGELEVLGGWKLASINEHFGGFSALAMQGDGSLLAASDKARQMRIALPLRRSISSRALDYFRPGEVLDKRLSDLEALARDPMAGTIWAAYENLNTLERVEPDGSRSTGALAEMADWPQRTGAEAIERLPDGRFLIIGESRGGEGSPALLYPGDPLDGGEPISFRFAGPAGFSPTGAAALSDGRVLILLRDWRIALPPRFIGAIVLADPADISDGGKWQGRVVARLEPPLPTDNYEGIAVDPQTDGSVEIWIISDDNFMRSQRTLLLKLRWVEDGHEKARGKAARPLSSRNIGSP